MKKVACIAMNSTMKRVLCIILVLLLVITTVGCGYSEKDIEKIQDSAYDDGYDEGHHDGFNEGYDKGSSDAWEEAQSIIAHAFEALAEATNEIEEYGGLTSKAKDNLDEAISILGEYY